MAMEFERAEFEEWVKEGLKVSHGINLDILPEDDLPSMLPTAPVAFALVTDSAAVDAADVAMPAMIPLPLKKLSVKARFYPAPSCMHVSIKATWTACFVKPTHFCDIFVAFPKPSFASGFVSVLDRFRFEIPNCSKPDVEPCFAYRPMFDEVYFVQRPQVDGGAEVCAFLGFTLALSLSHSGFFSFNIPLCFPFYTKNFRREKLAEVLDHRRCKIKIFILARKSQIISDYSLNFPHEIIMKYEGYYILLQELEDPNLEWPEGTLICSFKFVDKKVPRCDSLTSEIVESPEKKPRLGAEAL